MKYRYKYITPANMIDPDGYAATYVFYYNSPGSDFKQQALNSPYYNVKNVTLIPVVSAQDFINGWNSMSGNIDNVYLYLHGGEGKLYFKSENLQFSGKQSFSDLKPKNVKNWVFLFSCKGGSGKEGKNVAWMFAKLTGKKVWACMGSVSYTKLFGKYYARNAFLNPGFFTFYYAKKYIFFGKNSAKKY